MQRRPLRLINLLLNDMKRILIITVYFPPFLNMRAIRASKISKYLEREGWDVYVLTADGLNLEKGLPIEIDEKKILRVSFKKEPSSIPSGLKKSSFVKKFLNYQDRFLKWYFKALNVGREILSEKEFSIILSFSPPYPSNLLASRLSREFNLPWIAEFGDLWSENYYLKRVFPLSIFEKSLEKIVMKRAVSLISVSELLCSKLRENHGKEVFLFPHFFDEEDYEGEFKPYEIFTLTYTGHLYPYQDFKTFLTALKKIKNEGILESIKVKFYSYNYLEIKEWFKDFSELPIEINPQIPYREIIREQMSSSALLFFSIKNPEKTTENPIKGKIFSYIGSRKPVLVVGEDEGGKFLEKAGIGKICKNENEIMETILKWCKEFEEKKIVTMRNSFDWKEYSYKNRISELSNYLERFLKR